MISKETIDQVVSAAMRALDAGKDTDEAIASASVEYNGTSQPSRGPPLPLVLGLCNAFRERGLSVDFRTVQDTLASTATQSGPAGDDDPTATLVPTTGSRLQGQQIVFPNPEPWPKPVDGSDLLAELERVLVRHVALPEGASAAIALWILHAWTHNAARVSPVLALLSPEIQCGKTTVLELLSALLPRPLGTSNITTAGVFRMIEKYCPTLILDELDTFLPENNELRGILNSGHTQAMAYVVRTVKPDFEPRLFKTWAPKVLAKIGELPKTLADRAIIIPMRRCTPQEEAQLETLRRDRLTNEPLTRKAARWATDNLEILREADPVVPAGLGGRAADNWRPLFAIADLAGDDWSARARHAALLLTGSTTMQELAEGSQLLADIKVLFDATRKDRLSSEMVAVELGEREDRPWSEWRRGKPITKTQIARMLRPYGISPKDIRFKEGVLKGYYRVQFVEAWSRYLPTHPQQAQQPPPDGENQSQPDRNMLRSVADGQNGETLDDPDVVADVADGRQKRGRHKVYPASALNLSRRRPPP